MKRLPIDESIIPAEAIPEIAFYVVLVVGAFAVVRYLSRVGPRRARKFERIRTVVWRFLHPLDGKLGRQIPPTGEPRALLRDKTHSGEFVCSVNASQKKLEKALYKRGWRWNPISTKKYRMVDGEKQFAVNSWVYRAELFGPKQLHCYMFPTADGGHDIYCHLEDNFVRSPRGHTDAGNMVAGDPNGLLRAHLDDRDIAYIEEM